LRINLTPISHATALKGDLAETLATVFPCAWTYCDYGKRLKEQYKDSLENNFYKSWIETYADMILKTLLSGFMMLLMSWFYINQIKRSKK